MNKKIVFGILFACWISFPILSRAADPAFLAQRIDGPDEKWYGPFSEGCAVFDVNNDGVLDITAGPFWYPGPEFVRHNLREVKAHGEFISNGGEYPWDVNGDGWIDLISWGWFEDQNIYWYENPGAARTLWRKYKIADSKNTEFVMFEDMDGDGDPDLLPNLWSPHKVVWIEMEQGIFTPHSAGAEEIRHGIGLGDVDGDGRKDILTTRGWYRAPRDAKTSWQWNPEYDIGERASLPILVHDVNGDGLNDIIYGQAHDYGLFWLEQISKDGERSWVQRTIDDTWSQVHALVLFDINEDGQLDLITGKRLRGHSGKDPGALEPLGLYWYDMSRAPAAFSKHVLAYNAGIGTGMKIHMVDLDQDGDADIVVSGKSGLYWLENMKQFGKTVDQIRRN